MSAYRRVSVGRASLEFWKTWRDSRQPAALLRQRVGIGEDNAVLAVVWARLARIQNEIPRILIATINKRMAQVSHHLDWMGRRISDRRRRAIVSACAISRF